MDWIKEARKFFGGYDVDEAWGHSLKKDLPGMYKGMPQDEAERFASNYLSTKGGAGWRAALGNTFALPDILDWSGAARRKIAGDRGREAALKSK